MTDRARGTARWRRRPLTLGSAAAVAAVAAVALLAAGCGGGGSAGVASITSSTTATTTQNGLVAYSGCMRSHGVPNFPDPQRLAGGNMKLAFRRSGASPSQLRASTRACNHLLPPNAGPQQAAETPTQLSDKLSFARCMRSRGVSRFPDPTAQGSLSVEIVQAQGIDVHSLAFLDVVQACLPASHGALTPTGVREALHHSGG